MHLRAGSHLIARHGDSRDTRRSSYAKLSPACGVKNLPALISAGDEEDEEDDGAKIIIK